MDHFPGYVRLLQSFLGPASLTWGQERVCGGDIVPKACDFLEVYFQDICWGLKLTRAWDAGYAPDGVQHRQYAN
jgi:hypothetical protein